MVAGYCPRCQCAHCRARIAPGTTEAPQADHPPIEAKNASPGSSASVGDCIGRVVMVATPMGVSVWEEQYAAHMDAGTDDLLAAADMNPLPDGIDPSTLDFEMQPHQVGELPLSWVFRSLKAAGVGVTFGQIAKASNLTTGVVREMVAAHPEMFAVAGYRVRVK